MDGPARWQTPELIEIRMDAELGSYQPDEPPGDEDAPRAELRGAGATIHDAAGGDPS